VLWLSVSMAAGVSGLNVVAVVALRRTSPDDDWSLS
jgi:hypothetical protein